MKKASNQIFDNEFINMTKSNFHSILIKFHFCNSIYNQTIMNGIIAKSHVWYMCLLVIKNFKLS